MTALATVLVVDDEPSMRSLLRQYLRKEGYDVIEADDGAEALRAVRRGGVDLALVDIMIPEMDGLELVRRVRRISAIPIILLTARGEEIHRVTGLEIGADDYVVKPFSVPEVVARVRAQLRRAQGLQEPSGAVRIGSLELDPDTRHCRINGAEVELTRREFDLLAALAVRPGRVLTRQQLLDAVWGSPYLTEKTVDVHISGLRRKLGDSVRITALRGVGYRIEPQMTEP